MKVFLFNLSLFFLSTLASAQPVFDSYSIPQEGSSITSRAMLYTGSLPTGGANQTWDYSMLDFASTTPFTSYIYTDVANTPNGALFPTATHYFNDAPGEYNYYVFGSTSETAIGSVEGTDITTFTTPAKVSYDCPIAYNEVQTSSYTATSTHNGNAVAISGTTTVSYHGYGTLYTSDGSLYNIGKFKTVIDETQTEDDGGIPVVTRSVVEYNFWQFPSNPFYEFIIVSITNYNDGVANPTVNIAALYNNSIVTATSTSQQIAATLFPQPATEKVTINAAGLEGHCNATISRLDGSIVKQEQILNTAQDLNVSLNGIPTGLYIIEVSNGNKVVREKLVVK